MISLSERRADSEELIKLPVLLVEFKKIEHIWSIDRAQAISIIAVVSGPARYACSSNRIRALSMAPAAAGLEFPRAPVSINQANSRMMKHPLSRGSLRLSTRPPKVWRRHVYARSRPCCSESSYFLGRGCGSVSPSPQPPLASPRPSRMLRGQDPASSDLGAQTSDLPGSESSLAQDGAPVPGQGAGALGRPSTAATPDPLPGSGRALSAAAAGRSSPGSENSRYSGLNSIARNRLQREFAGAPEAPLNYPDLHEDPAKIYHDRFGVEEEHDRFAFPWLMNLIFEDRWLLAENNPAVALQNQLRRRMKVDIRDPDPDTANFPNGAYTLPKGRVYIENSPVGFYGRSAGSAAQYNWEYLFRYGMTDNLEFRIFSNGLTATRGRRGTVGFSPLAFDFKINFWEENTKYWLPAMGVELYIQTTFGSPAFNSGTQPSLESALRPHLAFGIQL